MAAESRFDRLERRVTALERAVLPPSERPEPEPPPLPLSAEAPQFRLRSEVEAPSPKPSAPSMSAGVVLAWGGGVALVLAAAYLIGIGITSGWLTPVRQVLAAAVAGLAMVGGGIALRRADRAYASLLGAAGVVILYLSVLGAYGVHELISALVAAGLVALIAAGALTLHLVYRSAPYAAFALLGSYSAPLLVGPGAGSLTDIALYLFVWNVTYCVISLRQKSRFHYIAAVYGSLLVFDAVWRIHFSGSSWALVAGFQAAIFVLFAVQLVLFSRKRPLSAAEAWGHFPALILFYGVEYALLEGHLPDLIPWLAVGFAGFLYGVYFAAGAIAKRPLSSASVVHTFGSLVLLHAVFIDMLDLSLWPLFGLIFLSIALVVSAFLKGGAKLEFIPYLVVTGLMYAVGLGLMLVQWNTGEVYLEVPLAFVYPALPYVLYALGSGMRRLELVSLGHIPALICIGLLVNRFLPSEGTTGRLWLSLAWALLGIALIIVAWLKNDRLLARSSLAIFGLFAAKVLLFDLSGADPLVRVGCLAILGVSLYGGGWVYRRIFATREQAG